MKGRVQFSVAFSIVLLTQAALALVPAARHVGPFADILADAIAHEKSDTHFAAPGKLPFLPDATAEAKRMIRQIKDTPVDPEVAALPVSPVQHILRPRH